MRYHTFAFIKEMFRAEIPFALRIHLIEGLISETLYTGWCRITGSKFERRPKTNKNACLLVTKRGIHLISNLLSKFEHSYIAASELEVYERNCSGNRWGTSSTFQYYRLGSNEFKCPDCGRPCRIEPDDVKIVGKL